MAAESTSRVGRHARVSAAALGAYFLVSLLCFGVHVLAHPSRDYIGDGVDPQIFIWSLAWWPHAILNGENPFVSNVIWAPDGVNLAWVTSIPGLALFLSPLTLLFGPVLAYNVAAVLMPALAAWTAFLLCRYVTGNVPAALVGGYLFGFSSYMLGQELGHLNLSAVFLLPLIALVVLRFLDGELTGRQLAPRLGLLFAAQFAISTEVSLSLAAALAVVLAAAFISRVPRRLGPLLASLAVACVLAAALVSPLLFYAVRGFESSSINAPQGWNADLANFAFPTRLVELGNEWTRSFAARFTGNDFERGAYLGIPVLVIVAWFAVLRWRTPAGRFLLLVTFLGVVAALGTSLTIAGASAFPLPWNLVARLPAFDNVLPARFTVFVALATAVIVSMWLASSAVPAAARLVLGAAAILSIAPNVALGAWHTHPRQPAFFTDRIYRQCLQPDENVVLIPYGSNGDSMLWQAQSGFAFRMAEGYVRPHPPSEFTAFPAVTALDENDPPPGGAEDVRRFARAKNVTTLILDAANSRRWRRLLAPLARPRQVAGVLVYRLASDRPADRCGRVAR